MCEAIGEDEVYSCMTMFKYVIRVVKVGMTIASIVIPSFKTTSMTMYKDVIRVLKVGMTMASIVIPSFKTTVVGGVRTWYDNCFVCHTEVSMKLV